MEGRDPRPSGFPRADHVAFSDRAEEFKRARSRLDGLPETIRTRVAELKALVGRGAYRVDGERIADAMLRDEATAGLIGFGTPP